MSNRLLVPKAKRLLLPDRRIFAPAVIIPRDPWFMALPGTVPPILAAVAGQPPVVPGTTTFNSGSGTYTVVSYNTLTIELWGGGASGGAAASGPINGNASTVSTYSLSAGGGLRSTTNATNANNAGPGGTASGGNTTNTNGGAGTAPSPTNGSFGTTGRGGNAPNGGLGGAAINYSTTSAVNGNPGNAPGGGGGGGGSFIPTGGGTALKHPGGGSGAYVKHVFTYGAGGSPAIGDGIAYSVAAAANPGNAFYGLGAAGRISFTVA